MLIKQNQLLGEATAFLDSLEPLSLDESTFTPEFVNVRHNPRLGQDLVQLESFLNYAQANGIDDAGLALHRVCEANEVPRDSLAFLANEENLLADDELLETFVQMREAGFPVHIARISDDSPYYRKLLEAISLDEAYDTYAESPNLIHYVNESIIDDAKAKISGAAGAVRDKVSGAVNSVKGAASDGAKAVSSKLASIRKEIAKKSSEMVKATGPAKVFIKKQIDKLKDAAKSLKGKLVSAKDVVGNKISAAGKSIRDTAASVSNKFSSAAGAVRDKVSGAADSVRSGISSIGNKVSDAASSVKNSVSSGIDKVKAKFA